MAVVLIQSLRCDMVIAMDGDAKTCSNDSSVQRTMTGCAGGVATPSAALLAAALAGLLGITSCGKDDAQGKVTLEREDPDMTAQKFEDACAEAMGSLETHAHCGGLNSCAGFSYDLTIGVYSEHTCRGLNTCTGWSCVVPKSKA